MGMFFRLFISFRRIVYFLFVHFFILVLIRQKAVLYELRSFLSFPQKNSLQRPEIGNYYLKRGAVTA